MSSTVLAIGDDSSSAFIENWRDFCVYIQLKTKGRFIYDGSFIVFWKVSVCYQLNIYWRLRPKQQ